MHPLTSVRFNGTFSHINTYSFGRNTLPSPGSISSEKLDELMAAVRKRYKKVQIQNLPSGHQETFKITGHIGQVDLADRYLQKALKEEHVDYVFEPNGWTA